MTTLARDYIKELKELATTGPLTPAAVLARARNPTNPLHLCFEWDDSAAAESYRLTQAGQLIKRARVTIFPSTRHRVSVRVSQVSDVVHNPRPLAPVVRIDSRILSAKTRKAFDELSDFRKRYDGVTELAGVFVEVDKLFLTPGAHAKKMLDDAVQFAIALEKKGADRRTATQRAASTYGLGLGVVATALREAV